MRELTATRKDIYGYGLGCYARKADRGTAQYRPLGGSNTQACANCLFFISPNACTVVDPYPDVISPTGISKFWTAIPDPRQTDPLRVVIVDEEGNSSHLDDDKSTRRGVYRIAIHGKAAACKADPSGGQHDYIETDVTGCHQVLTCEGCGEESVGYWGKDRCAGCKERASKQVTKTEGGVEYKASDYAVVPDSEKPSGWKLRLAEESSGNFTVAQVARAITAMQPSGFRGQPVQFGSGEKAEAVRKIGTAIGKSGGTKEQKDNLRERLNAVKDRGPLARFMEKFAPKAPPATSSMQFEKTADGIRWITWASNKYRDRDNPPEILEEKAHEGFIKYLEAGGPYPELWMWHVPGSKWGQADMADYFDGFLFVSGLVDKGMEDVADAVAADPGLGVSHGFRGVKYSDKANGIISEYRTYEISPLPLKEAANPWTSIQVLLKEAATMGMHENQRKFLVEKLGEDRVAAIESGTEDWGKALAALGIEAKSIPEAEGEPRPDADSDAKAVADGVTPDAGALEAMAAAAVKAMNESPVLKEMSESVKAQGAQITEVLSRLDAVEKSEDEKITARLMPRVAATLASKRASESPDNVDAADGVRKDDKNQPVDDMAGILGQMTVENSQGAARYAGAS